jgi:acetyltransferase-like isoleucine patch superfamily enzyme
MTDGKTIMKKPGAIPTKLAYRLYLASMPIESMWALRLRRRLLDFMIGRKHAHLNVFAHVFIDGIEGLSLGDHVSINRRSTISAAGGLKIGDNVSIAHDTSILTSNHGWKDHSSPIKYQPITYEPVVIGSNVWIGAKVCILAGVTIPPGTIVAAASVVTRSFEEQDTIIGGVPAKRIKGRFE